MKSNAQNSIRIMLGLVSIVTVLHLLIIVKIIPYKIAWGGRLQNDTEMYVFETLSIFINMFLGLILLMKGGYIRFQFKKKTINIILWVFLILFIVNTVGNLFAETNFEKLFSLVTLTLAVLIWKILRIKQT